MSISPDPFAITIKEEPVEYGSASDILNDTEIGSRKRKLSRSRSPSPIPIKRELTDPLTSESSAAVASEQQIREIKTELDSEIQQEQNILRTILLHEPDLQQPANSQENATYLTPRMSSNLQLIVQPITPTTTAQSSNLPLVDAVCCCVRGCQVNKNDRPELLFFPLPTDSARRVRWLERIRRKDIRHDDGPYYVCSLHFHLAFDLKKNSTQLKMNAAPSYNLPTTNEEETQLKMNVTPSYNLKFHTSEIAPKASTQNELNQKPQNTNNVTTLLDQNASTQNLSPQVVPIQNVSIPYINTQNVFTHSLPTQNPSYVSTQHVSLQNTPTPYVVSIPQAPPPYVTTLNVPTPYVNTQNVTTQNISTQTQSVVNQHVYTQTINNTTYASKQIQTLKKLSGDPEQKITHLRKQLMDCRKQLRDESTLASQKEVFDRLCDRFLSENLADLIKAQTKLKDNHTGNRYSNSYKNFCINLHEVSPQAYSILQKAFYLPCSSTLKKTLMPVSTQVEDKVIEKFKIKVDAMTDLEKNCTVAVDSIVLTSSLFYSINFDKIIGFNEVDGIQSPVPARHMMVILVQGLFVQWAQPIGYAFLSQIKNNDNDVAQWILKVLAKLTNTGLKVRAFTSNIGPVFSDIADQHLMSIERPYFFVNDAKIYYIFDSKKLLLELRDTFMKYNFCYLSDNVAKFDHIKQFYYEDSKKSIRLAEKLTQKHINPKPNHKVNIDYATELFSKSVAAGISTYVDFSAIHLSATNTVNFILMINDLYNALNSSISFEDNHKIEFLQEMLRFFSSLSFVHSRNESDVIESFQFKQSFQITIASLLSLIEDLKSEGHKRLLTSWLSLNQIHIFFDKLRSKDNYGLKPTCRQLVPAFRSQYFAYIRKRPRNGRPEDVSNFLFKLNEFSKSHDKDTPDDSVLTVDKRPGYVFHEIRPTHYDKIKVPEENTFFYFTEFLFKKCVEKHGGCQILQPKLDASTSLFDFHEFITYVENMETKYREAFDQTYISSEIGKFILEQIQLIPFESPCPCFPNSFLQKLFTRARIFLSLKYNNKVLRTYRNRREHTFSADKLL